MKKLLKMITAAMLALCTLVSLVACGGSANRLMCSTGYPTVLLPSCSRSHLTAGLLLL